MLSPAEFEEFKALRKPDDKKAQWLFGRAAAKDAVRRVKEMTYDNAEDFLVRAQEAANFFDNEGRKEGIKQFIDDKTFKPGGSDPRELGFRVYHTFIEPK